MSDHLFARSLCFSFFSLTLREGSAFILSCGIPFLTTWDSLCSSPFGPLPLTEGPCGCLWSPHAPRAKLGGSSISECTLFFCWESPLPGPLCQVLSTHLFFNIMEDLFSIFFETRSEHGLSEGYLFLHRLCHRHTLNPFLLQVTQTGDIVSLYFRFLRGETWSLIKSIWLGLFF